MSKLRLLDLFCCAGGAGEGYKLAGFDVVGVDIKPQKNNPHTFILGDALEYCINNYQHFDAIHASPPCQQYSSSTRQWRKLGYQYDDLISKTREVLQKTGKLYVIENVPNSPLINPILLNGSVFNLKVHRPRLFETNFYLPQPHVPKVKPVKMGRKVQEGEVIQPVGNFIGVDYARKVMEISWMTGKELSQAIPPAYTKWIGQFIIKNLN